MKKKILIALLVILLVVGAGFAYIYCKTDLLKSEKEIFFSHLKNEKGILTEQNKLEEYLNKKEKNSYTNTGKVTIDVSGIDDETSETINNMKIDVNGKVNNNKKQVEEKVTVDTGMGIIVPVVVKTDNNAIGIQSDLVSEKNIAIKNENLKAIAEKFGLDSEEIPDKLDFEKSEFTEEELKTLGEKYYNLIYNELPEDAFSKEKNGNNGKIVTLSLTEEKLNSILTKIFEELKNDELIKSKIPDEMNVDEFVESIDDAIEELNESVNSNDKAEFKIYIQNNKLNKIEILIYEDEEIVGKIIGEATENGAILKIYEEDELLAEVTFDVVKSDNDIEFNFECKVEETILKFKITYKNIVNLDNVEEIYSYVIENDDENIKCEFSNTIKFDSNVEIEGINDDNSIFLNTATDEELEQLIINVYQNLGLM